MEVVYLGEGLSARDAETSLVRFALRTFPERCRNRAADSRGVSAQVLAFVYIYLSTLSEDQGAVVG